MFLIYLGTDTYTEETGLGSLSISTDDVFQTSKIRGEELLNLYPSLFSAVTKNDTILVDDNITSDKIAPGVLKVETTTITTAEILAMFTTPIELVAAPAVGSYISVESINVSVDYVSAAYATNTTLEFRYTDGSGTKVTADVAALLTATADKVVRVGDLAAETVITTNAALVTNVATGNPITGDSDIKITVAYRILSI